MKHYVLATQREWGRKVFEEAIRADEKWFCHDEPDGLADSIRIMAPRYTFFVNWSAIVPPDVLALTEPINFHAFGPGPIWHRGGGPIEGLLLRGYTETMIWAHRMTAEVDAGDVYASRGPIRLSGTKQQILDRFVDPVVSLIREIVETEPEPYPQAGPVVNFKRLDKAAYEVFWKART